MTWMPLRDRWQLDDTTTALINNLANRLEREAHAAHHRTNCCPEGAVVPENCRHGGHRYTMSVDEVLGALVAGGWLPRAALVTRPTPPELPRPASTPDPAEVPRSTVADARLQFAEKAKAAYLDATPQPTEIDVSCPRCKAQVGQPCAWPRRPARAGTFHAPRLDRVIAVVHARQVGAMRAFDAAWDAWGARR
ncbi:hypothetical protein AB0B94_31115 [Micromonospora sp. NPDC048986]|uniref:zinc finger domain-containing protein n=1 Tax=Micromonospora sp. NPDC048986 TaxID=3155644 RepID=UPI0033E84692